ncbi:hypothetical protein B0A48_05767 [Cryoendolithus antarcticus]|uniref:PRA1 family protein n=1 Tax=Cryoendolithus antarcticus TaxID=1507870 RepID=A0A1V8TBW1_9PEZI|nr:hypothetical protein B0A48_05767 [Cryoendolithus antarcticus]
MARINIPIEALTSRLNLSSRFDSVRSQSVANRFANLKPISEFLDIKRVSKPRDFGDLQSRVNYNLGYFSSNYAVLFVMLAIYCLLTSKLLAFVILLVVGGMWGIGKLQGRDLDVGFAKATTSQLYTGLFVIATPLFFWSGPFSALFWLLGASGVTILGHAALLERDVAASFSEEAEQELRNAAVPFGQHYEEYDSQDEYEQGAYLDADGYPIDGHTGGFAGDELHFTGYDLGQHRYGSHPDAYAVTDDEYYQRSMEQSGRDAALAQAAYDRIARARAQGTTNVSLSLEEMEVLERRRGIQQPAPVPPPLQVASPPATPKKAVRGKANSRENSSSSLSSLKGRKKLSTGLFGPSTPPSAMSNSKAKVRRTTSAERTPVVSPAAQPPGVMIPGPNSVPVYAPYAYYPQHSPEAIRAQPVHGRTRARSTSQHTRRDSTPPEPVYAPYPPRYYPVHPSMRPPSSGSPHSARDQEEADYYLHPPLPPQSRVRSASNAQYAHPEPYYPGSADPSSPAAQGQRRHFSGPADMSYATLRRVPPASSPLASRPGIAGMGMHYSDPALGTPGRKGSGLSREMESGSSGSEEQGVPVRREEDGRVRESEREVVAGGSKTVVKGNEARRRKARR